MNRAPSLGLPVRGVPRNICQVFLGFLALKVHWVGVNSFSNFKNKPICA